MLLDPSGGFLLDTCLYVCFIRPPTGFGVIRGCLPFSNRHKARRGATLACRERGRSSQDEELFMARDGVHGRSLHLLM